MPRDRRSARDRFNRRPLGPSQRSTPSWHSRDESLSREPFDHKLHDGPDDDTSTTSAQALSLPNSSLSPQSSPSKLDVPKKATAFGTGHDDIDLSPTDEEQNAALVSPTEHPDGSRTWRHELGADAVAYGLLIPKNVGRCEDAPPLVVKSVQSDHSPTFLGVLDGMGGAGAGQVTYEPKKSSNEVIVTSEALLASRLVRREIVKLALSPQEGELTERLKATVHSRLEKTVKLLQLGEKSRIRGTMTKRLPTTLVLTRVSRHPSAGVSNIETWWAGDSRAFIITPRSGLIAMTSDHVRNLDPLDQLRSDPPIENVVNCSTAFFIEKYAKSVKGPFVLLLATDGVFGYLPTPGYLELGLLESLTAGGDAFAELFSGFCSRFAADDVSAAVLVSGFASHEALEEAFRTRLQTLRDRYAKLEALIVSNSDVNEEVQKLWRIERTGYLFLRGDSRE